MSQRERLLAIGVGVVVLLLMANVGFKKLTTTLTQKENRVENAQNQLNSLDSAISSGQRASTKIQRLESRSLPRSQEQAEAQYNRWLYQLAEQVGLTGVKVIPTGRPNKIVPQGMQNTTGPNGVAEAYSIHEFLLSGECRSDKVIDLLAKFYDRDYLHRIKSLKINPTREPNTVSVELSSEAISLARASDEQQPSLESSGRLAMKTDEYKQRILERNPFSPPNNGPRFETGRSHDVTIGRPWSLRLEAKDPEGDEVKYELLTSPDKLPPGLTLRGGEISWQPKEKMEQELLVKATDSGWPHQSSEMKLVLKAIDPPPPPVPETRPTTIDPAKQAFITGLVSGRTGAQGWIRSKAEGLSIDIAEGTEIKVGSISAKVLKINPMEDYVELETDGTRWIADMDTSLADAFAKSKID